MAQGAPRRRNEAVSTRKRVSLAIYHRRVARLGRVLVEYHRGGRTPPQADETPLSTYGRKHALDFCNDGVPAGADYSFQLGWQKPCGINHAYGCPGDPVFRIEPKRTCLDDTLPDGERTVHGLRPMLHDSLDAFRPKLIVRKACSFAWSEGAETLGGTATCVRTGDRYALADTFAIRARENTVLLRKVGHFEHLRSDTVKATVDYRVSPPSTGPAGQVILALQTLNPTTGQWTEVDRRYSNPTQDGEQSVSAKLEPNTTFRLEVWTGELGIDEVDVGFRTVSIFIPECVPDATRPGECL